MVYFTKRDVVRHKLVQDIIEAYEGAEKRKSPTTSSDAERS
jgi:phosphate starvation-inducible protein PhoH